MRVRMGFSMVVGLVLATLVGQPESRGAPNPPAPKIDQAALREAQEASHDAQTKSDEGKYAEAVVAGERAVALREKLSPQSKMVVGALRDLAQIHQKAGHYAESVPPLEQALAIEEKNGVKGFELQIDVNYLARALVLAKLYERAVAAYQREITIAVEVDGGKEGAHATEALTMIAAPLSALHRYQEAEQYLFRAIKIREAEGIHTGLHHSLLELGRLYREQGLYAQAEPVLTRSTEIALNASGMGQAQDPMRLLALTLEDLDKFAKATVLMDKLVDFAKEAGEERASYVILLGMRADLDIQMGAFDHAAVLLGRAQEIVDKLVAKQARGAKDVGIAIAGARGLLSLREGDLDRAEKPLLDELDYVEKRFGPKDKLVADASSELADLHRKAGRLEKADVFALRALTIRDEALATTHPDRAESRAVLGRIREARGDVAGAKKLHEEALAMREKAFGREHPLYGSSLLDLADLARRQGQTDVAESHYKSALVLFEKAFSPDHEKVAVALEGLSSVYVATNKVELAVRLSERAADIRERQAALIIAGGSDAQKRAFVSALHLGTDFVTNLHVRVAPNDEKAKRLALTTIFQRKGRVLDVMAGTSGALRKRLSPGDAKLFDEVAQARADVARLAMRGPAGAPLDEFRKEIAKYEEKARSLEEKLGGQSDVFRAEQIPVTIERVQAAIPDDMVLVELNAYVPRNAAESGPKARLGPARIAAYVLDTKGKISFVDLGENAPIEQAAAELRKGLSSPDGLDNKKLGRAVDEMVMAKIRPLLGGKNHLLISADGALSLIPFAALVDEEGHYFVEKFETTYLTSGRDLIRLSRQNRSTNGAPVVLANPAFGSREQGESALALLAEGSSATAGANGGAATRGFEKAYFEPLPATGAEARKISALMPNASVLVDVEATETAVKNVHAPKLLHIATHGFFVSLGVKSMRTADSPERGLELDIDSNWLPDDPLLRSGIALAGANAKKGGGGEDGILTALEACSLDLQGTKLVVMSACETGIGDVMQGEGIYGLRRALFIAGTESLVASLWKVADEETQSLMVAYYGRILKGETRAGALRNVQTSMLATPATAHPYYWASFGIFGNSAAIGSDPVTTASETPKTVAPSAKVLPGARGCSCEVFGPRDFETNWPLLLGFVGLSLARGRRRLRVRDV